MASTAILTYETFGKHSLSVGERMGARESGYERAVTGGACEQNNHVYGNRLGQNGRN